MFAQWLDASLRRRGWTPAQLARRVTESGSRVPESEICALREGAETNLTPERVVLLARALGELPGEALIAAETQVSSCGVERFNRPLVVGVAGGTGAGKTFVATWIVAMLGRTVAERVEMDWYVRPAEPGSSPADREAKNYDLPEAYELDALARDLTALRQASAVEAPQYDFERHDRAKQRRLVQPLPVIVVEGIFLFWDRAVRDLLDLRVFVEAAGERRFQRRLRRDQLSRGRSESEVRRRYGEHAQPGYVNYIEPTRKFADLILLNDSDDLFRPPGLEAVIAWVLQRRMS